jgi:hypothetical protein
VTSGVLAVGAVIALSVLTVAAASVFVGRRGPAPA